MWFVQTVDYYSVFKKKEILLGTMAHTCNPHYSGGRHWKDYSLRSAQAKSSQEPISTKKKKKQQKIRMQ
jgi:hypothetical protein